MAIERVDDNPGVMAWPKIVVDDAPAASAKITFDRPNATIASVKKAVGRRPRERRRHWAERLSVLGGEERRSEKCTT